MIPARSTLENDRPHPLSVVSQEMWATDSGQPARPSLTTGRELSLSFLTRSSGIAMAGGLVSQGLKFLVVIYVARRFSPAEFGWFSFAVAVNAYLSIVSNFGLPVFGSRAVSKAGVVPRDLLEEIVCIRLFLALAATAVSVVILSMAPRVSHAEFVLVALFGLSNVPLSAFFDWVFQGLHRQGASAILNVVWQGGWLAFTAIGIGFGMGILAVATALATSALLASAVGYLWLRQTHMIVQTTGGRTSLFRRSWHALRAAAPLGWGTMWISVVVWTDVIYVRLLRGEVAVGIYAAGNRAALALSMLGTFYVQGAFPLLSHASGRSASCFEQCFTRTFADLTILFVPGSFWAICYAREIIALIFGRADYVSAAPVFRIFQVTLLLFVMNNLLGTGVLVAFHRDRIFRRVLLTAAIVFLIVCPVLTWVWGNWGAATAVLASQTLSLVWFVVETRPLVRLQIRRALGLPLVLAMASVAVCLTFHLSLLAGVVPVTFAYMALATWRFSSLPGRAESLD